MLTTHTSGMSAYFPFQPQKLPLRKQLNLQIYLGWLLPGPRVFCLFGIDPIPKLYLIQIWVFTSGPIHLTYEDAE